MGAAGQGAGMVDGRWMVSPRTLCFVFNGDDVLLMKRGPHRRIFPNKYNGLGGHVERDEDVRTSITREVLEESGLVIHDLRLCGVHHIDAGAETGIFVFVFVAQSESRDLTVETDEGTLEWVNIRTVGGLDLVDDVNEVLNRIQKMSVDAPPYFAHVSYDEADNLVIQYA